MSEELSDFNAVLPFYNLCNLYNLCNTAKMSDKGIFYILNS